MSISHATIAYSSFVIDAIRKFHIGTKLPLPRLWLDTYERRSLLAQASEVRSVGHRALGTRLVLQLATSPFGKPVAELPGMGHAARVCRVTALNYCGVPFARSLKSAGNLKFQIGG